jgi:hypothetical protein
VPESQRTEKYDELAARLGVSSRTCKGWEATGIRAGDSVPWGEPLEIVEWFERVKGRKMSAKLQASLESAAAREVPVAPSAEPVADEGLGELFAAPRKVNGAGKGRSVEETMASLFSTLSREAGDLEQALQDAKIGGDDSGMVRARRNELVEIAEKLRQLAKGIQSDLVAQGEYIARSRIAETVTAIHSVVRKTYRQAFRRARPAMIAAGTSEEWAALVDATADQADAALVECEFREVSGDG